MLLNSAYIKVEKRLIAEGLADGQHYPTVEPPRAEERGVVQTAANTAAQSCKR